MNERDQTYFEDMLSYSADAIAFLSAAERAERADLAADKLTRYALIRAVEIVGEAASKVSPDARAELADLPWRRIIGMRNTLILGYRGMNLDLLVEVVRDHLPSLVSRLEQILGDDPK